ncbi:hypothetical protein GCM10008940_29430 [Microbulbifer agarilyticus]
MYFEITKSENQIAMNSEPSSSFKRGETEAENNFSRGHRDFKLSSNKHGDIGFLGIDEDKIERILGYVPLKYVSHSCIVMSEGYESWVVPEHYKSNNFYVIGYNRRMLELLANLNSNNHRQ